MWKKHVKKVEYNKLDPKNYLDRGIMDKVFDVIGYSKVKEDDMNALRNVNIKIEIDYEYIPRKDK